MDVPGRKDLKLSENEDSVAKCESCLRDSDADHSKKYSKNCNEFVCAFCNKAHRKFVGTKNLPDSQNQDDDFTKHCDVHETEIVKFYCKEHYSVGCGDCIVLNHISCKVQLISDVSGNYGDSSELVEIKHRIDHLRKNLLSCQEEISRSLKTAEEIRAGVIKEIKQFRKDIDDYLDKVEADILQKVEEINTKDVTSQEKLLFQCETLCSEIEEFQSKLEQCKDKANNLFVTSKSLLERLPKYQELNKEISAKSQIHSFKFTSSEYVNALKVRNTSLGILNTQVQRFAGDCKKTLLGTKARYVQKINMQAKKETECFITGMTIISENEIMCADKNSLKVFDFIKGKVTSVLKLTSLPADVTTLNSSYAATTLPNEGKILCVITQSGLRSSHSLDVRKGCMGIDHHNGTMAVSFTKPPAVQVINMEGRIIHEVRDTSILKSPIYVSLCYNNEKMFVSDRDNGAVYEFTKKGELIATYTNEEMGFPLGTTVTNCGCAVVCYPGKSDQVGLAVSGTTKILPFVVQNVLKSSSILISEDQRKLFISEHLKSKDCNFIKIFDLE